MKFPLIKKGQSCYPKDFHYCPVCNKDMNKENETYQIILELGALKSEGKNNYSILDKKDGGFMSISTHSHTDKILPHGSLEIVDMSNYGQAELAFCSSKCLRKFFNNVVDEFEKEEKKSLVWVKKNHKHWKKEEGK